MIILETIKGDIFLEHHITRAFYDVSEGKYYAQPHGTEGITLEITKDSFYRLSET